MSRLYPLLLALLCVLGCVQLAQGQSFVCNYKGNLGWYDLKPLKGTQITGSDPALPPAWNYFLNMCDVASGTSATPCTTLSPGAMVCQSYKQTPTGNTYAIAYPNDASKTHEWAEITTPYAGIQLTAYGAAATNCPQGFKLSVIQIKCDPTATTVPSSLSGFVVESPQCTYTLQFAHASACPSQTPPASDDSGDGSGGISGGTIFLIVALVGGFVYVAGGCFYKRYQKGTTGMIESCPNNEFWTAIPGLVKDGCLYTVRKLKSLCGGSGSTSGGTGSYENI